MIDKKQPIIIKKVFHGGHGHHGGAWKVAFADFVTAMMAFFMLMWLMGSTTKEERAAISEYFNNPSMSPGRSTAPAPNAVQGPGGASTSLVKLGGGAELYKEQEKEKEKEKAKSDKELEEEETEKKRLDNLMESLKEAMEKSQALQPFKDQLLLDITPEGLRIQIVDKENRPMFDSGGARLKHYTYDILRELARYIAVVPNHISISGHTDATPYPGENYTNWELSSDRANAARRVLADNGVVQEKINRVVGLASSVLFDKENPRSPVNRRIAIVVMNKKSAEAVSKSEGRIEPQQQEEAHAPSDIPLAEPGKAGAAQEAAPHAAPAVSPQAQPEPKGETRLESKPVPKPAEPAMQLPMEYL